MKKINIKPLSINEAWQGKRFKTKKYKKYCEDVFIILPMNKIPHFGPLKATYEFGVSNMQSDVDNMVKPFQDQLQTKYVFNDNRIMEFTASKVKVKKGCEYIKFSIEAFR